jgi:hypothetical protein
MKIKTNARENFRKPKQLDKKNAKIKNRFRGTWRNSKQLPFNPNTQSFIVQWIITDERNRSQMIKPKAILRFRLNNI